MENKRVFVVCASGVCSVAEPFVVVFLHVFERGCGV